MKRRVLASVFASFRLRTKKAFDILGKFKGVGDVFFVRCSKCGTKDETLYKYNGEYYCKCHGIKQFGMFFVNAMKKSRHDRRKNKIQAA